MTRNPLFKKLLNDWPAKVISLVVAILIYLVFQFNTLDRKTLSVPLHVHSNGMVINTSSIQSYARLTLKGKGEDLSKLIESDISVYIDLQSISQAGTYELPVQIKLSENSLLITPLDISVEPDYIKVSVEEKATAFVPIEPSLVGVPADGYEIDSYTVEPEFIQINGPKSIVESTEKIITDMIPINGISRRITQDVSILNNNNAISLKKDTVVNVSVQVRNKEIERTISGTDIYFFNLQENLEVITNIENYVITLKGPQNTLTQYELTPYAIRLDCLELTTPGTYEVSLSPYLPNDFEVISIEPQIMTVEVKEKDMTTDNLQTKEE